MAYNKIQMTKAHNIGVKDSLPVSILDVDYRKQSTPIESRSHGHLSNLLQRLFRIFTSENKIMNTSANNENAVIRNRSELKDDETQSLLDLENFANAARETEACCQYEWINTSDE